MKQSYASLLVFHGSRNIKQYLTKVVWLNSLVQKKLWRTDNIERLDMSQISHKVTATNTNTIYEVPLERSINLVDLAILEFARVELSQQIVDFAQKAIAHNFKKISIVPVFLSAGVHVKEDIPEAIAKAQKQLKNSIIIEQKEYIGSSPNLIQLIDRQFQQSAADKRILLAHGSRLPKGNVAIEQLAEKVDAIVAYWTVQPDLISSVESLVSLNVSSIKIVPYFLFSGRITEAIASVVKELQNKFSQVEILYGEPFGATSELAQIIAEHIIKD